MRPINDPHLAELFAEEIRERAERLVRNGRAWQSGDRSDEVAEEAQRDAHTIKGNAGFVSDLGLSEAALLVERLWRQVRHEHRPFTAELAEALVGASEALRDAAMNRPRRPEQLASICRLLDAANPFEVHVVTDDEETLYSLAVDLPDLGGLVADEVPHFLDEISPINSENFGRLVDAIAKQRLDTEALIAALHDSLKFEEEGRWRAATSNLLGSVRELFDEAASLTLTEASQITNPLGQLLRYISRRSGKDVALRVVGGDTLADRYILDVLREPIRHLVVNAVEHGIELPAQRLAAAKPRRGTVTVAFSNEDDVLSVSVSDDGRGISWSSVASVRAKRTGTTEADDTALAEELFAHGFTTVEVPTQFSGDGVGLELVARTVGAMDGAVQVESAIMEGTTVTMRVPRLRAMQRLQVVNTRQQRWGLPAAAVLDVLEIGQASIRETEQGPMFMYDGRPLPYAPLGEVLGGSPSGASHAVIVGTVGLRYALGSVGPPARLSGITKQLGPSLLGADLLSGAALFGGGDFVAILDARVLGRAVRGHRAAASDRPRVLLVDDSRAARQLLEASLTSAGFLVTSYPMAAELLAGDDAWSADLILTDLKMPDFDGIELVERLRELGVETPIVVLSGVANEHEMQQALDVGADLFIEKADLRHGAVVEAVRGLVRDAGKPADGVEKRP